MTSYLESLRSGLARAMADDERVYVLGEDILDPYGGAFKVTKGLSERFPDRVMTTPISEAGITGLGAGMALRGLRPVVEIMFGDFLTLAADQIVNHLTKFGLMYDGRVSVPMVIRTPMGGGRGYGATHSQSIEKMFMGVPGLRVVAPSHLHDPGALLGAAIAEDGPVLFIENKLLYPMPLQEGSATLSFDRGSASDPWPVAVIANHRARRADIAILAYGGMSRVIIPLMESLATEEIALTGIFPASIAPPPVDAIVDAIGDCGRVVIVEEGTEGFNWGSELAACLSARLHGRLETPIARVAAASTIIPSSQAGEASVLPGPDRIQDTLLEVLA